MERMLQTYSMSASSLPGMPNQTHVPRWRGCFRPTACQLPHFLACQAKLTCQDGEDASDLQHVSFVTSWHAKPNQRGNMNERSNQKCELDNGRRRIPSVTSSHSETCVYVTAVCLSHAYFYTVQSPKLGMARSYKWTKTKLFFAIKPLST
jgi:hypothetical protein